MNSDHPPVGKFSGKRILLAWNGYQYNITGAIEDYLVSEGAEVFSVIQPLFPGDSKRMIRRRIGDHKVETTTLAWLPLRSPLSYFLDPVVPWRLPKADIAIGFNCAMTNRFLLRRLRGKVRVVIQWNIDFSPIRFKSAVLNYVYKSLDKKACLFSDFHVDLNSRALLARQTLYKLKSDDRGKVVPVGIWRQKIISPTINRLEKPSIVFLGNLMPRLGIELFLNVAAIAQSRLTGLSIDVIGGGAYLGHTKEYASQLGLKSVVFHGNLTENEFMPILGRCCIGFAPYVSDPDSFSNFADPSKVKNYIQASLPVFISNVTHNAQLIVDKGAGEIIGTNPTEIADSTIALIGDPELWMRKALASESLATEYDWNELLDKFFDLEMNLTKLKKD
jgi:glycosyltransferase involved in cell wall biosynthesis